MRATLTLLVVLCAGCVAGPAEPEPVDMRLDFPEAPAGALVWETPAYTIPPGTEIQMCWVTTYDGPDMGITGLTAWQVPAGHHALLFGARFTERERPDGDVWDCTDSQEMAETDPVIIGGVIEEEDGFVINSIDLPDGMAAVLEEGQRIMLQSHYINSTADSILVADELHVSVIPEADVVTWAAPWTHTDVDFEIPANSAEYTVSFDCTWDDDVQLITLAGHMHEWGSAFLAEDLARGDLLRIHEWTPEMRDLFPYADVEPGDLSVMAGDVFRTTCTWSNPDGPALGFPNEMCATFGMAYPSRVPLICTAD